MRITKKLKEARAAFQQRVANFIKAVGAIEHDGAYRFNLDTPIGPMRISLWDSAIMCRFDDVEKATEFTRHHTSQACNRFSGKWNWHFDDSADCLNAQPERDFVRYVTKLMSLYLLLHDLSEMTPRQTEHLVQKFSTFPLRELRRRQDLTTNQIKAAHAQHNDSALANLRVREEHLRLAIDHKVFVE